MRRRTAPSVPPGLLRAGMRAVAVAALIGLPCVAGAARAGDPPPAPPSSPAPPALPTVPTPRSPAPPSTAPTPPPGAPARPAFLAPEAEPGALGRLENVAELAAAGDRVAAVLTDGGLRVGTRDAVVPVPTLPGGDGWLHAAVPARGPTVATTRRGYVHRVADDGSTTVVGRIQRGALPAASTFGGDVVLATEGGAVYRVVAEGGSARLVETWPSGAEPASAVGCAHGRVVVARTTGVVEAGPLEGPATRWLPLASPVTALSLGDGWAALGDTRGRVFVVAQDAATAGEPTPPLDAEITALAVLKEAPGPDDAPLRIVVLEAGRRLRLHRASRAGGVRAHGAPLALEPGARGVVAAGGDAVWLIGTDGRVRRVAAAP